MASTADVAHQPRIFFTAPWDPVVVRRGDALGLRALADEFAEAVAPGLSNRVRDGRWVTILAWCLVHSQEVFRMRSGPSVSTASEQRARYGWLRPLELMWVARTIELADEAASNRSMSGQRSIRRWRDTGQLPQDRFGMSEEQFRAYRQTGMYGGYRIAFRTWPGLTENGDGWTPGPVAHDLAKWLDKQLGRNLLPTWNTNRAPTVGKGEEHIWWLRRWATFNNKGRDYDVNTLPRLGDDFKKLPEKEAVQLEPIIFGSIREKHEDCRRRRSIALEVAKSSGTTHIEICEHLSQTFSSDPIISYLARFSRLADTGIEAMDLIANQLARESATPLKTVEGNKDVARACKDLRAAASEWLSGEGSGSAMIGVTHCGKASDFAQTITSVEPQNCVKALLDHHEQRGGGLLWFVRRGLHVELCSTPTDRVAAPYRFRLWSLCRLAAQCGVIKKMPPALSNGDVESSEHDDESE